MPRMGIWHRYVLTQQGPQALPNRIVVNSERFVVVDANLNVARTGPVVSWHRDAKNKATVVEQPDGTFLTWYDHPCCAGCGKCARGLPVSKATPQTILALAGQPA